MRRIRMIAIGIAEARVISSSADRSLKRQSAPPSCSMCYRSANRPGGHQVPHNQCRARRRAVLLKLARYGAPGPGFRSLDPSVTRRSVCKKGVEKLMRRSRHLRHRALESELVYFGGSREATQLSYELN